MEKRAFYDATTKMLTAWGYTESNCRQDINDPTNVLPCDPWVEVPWDFDLIPGQWRLVDGTANPPTWEPYP
ncbi:hypothetical protein [Herbaspirillum aquaticum]|uniref:hypothetical protein n=1 Tax=Herbaspirillum aquaticum TaxID=568783 RepID=UPI0011318517|nr:hypothetical protein [Herbaspirillum aquaticum]